MPVYQPNIPTGLVDLDEDYLNLRGNFQQLNIAYGVDHVPFSDTSGTFPSGITGIHTNIHFNPFSTTSTNPPNNYPPAVPSATGGFGQLFSVQSNDGFNTDELLYFLSGGNRLMQLTRNFQPQVSASSTNGFTFLPGGLVMQWGVKLTPGSSGTINFIAEGNMNFSNGLFNVQLTASRTNATGSPTAGIFVVNSAATFDKTQFSYISSTSGSAAMFWMAIGY